MRVVRSESKDGLKSGMAPATFWLGEVRFLRPVEAAEAEPTSGESPRFRRRNWAAAVEEEKRGGRVSEAKY